MKSVIDFRTRLESKAASRLLLLKVLLLCLVLATPLIWSVWITLAASRTWIGGVPGDPTCVANNLWTNQCNWSGKVLPSAGDDLIFGSSFQNTSFNSFTSGTTFGSITITSHAIVASNSVSLNSGITATNAAISLTSIKLNLSQSFTVPLAGTSANIISSIDTNTRRLALDGQGNLLLQGSITGSGGVSRIGKGLAQLTGTNTYTGLTIVEEGTLLVSGAQSSSNVLIEGGTLGGTGTVGSITLNPGGKISPGGANNGTGTLTGVGNVNFPIVGSGNLDLDLKSATPGSGYDQLKVEGTVFLRQGDPNLNLNLGFTPAAGTTFTIIDNDGNDAITGQFAGRPEGSLFTVNSTMFVISYKGGDGNDVVLHVPEVKEWTGASGSNSQWTTGANWVGGTAPQPGDILTFVAGALRLTNSNDFPPGTTFTEVAISGTGYNLIGNGITLNAGIQEFVTGGANNAFSPAIKLNADQTFSSSGPGGRTLSFGSVDTNGKTLTVSGSTPLHFLGTGITGTGGLTREGTGFSILVGNNTYTGPTNILSGALRVDGSLTQSPITVTGGTLQGGGNTGQIIANGGTVSPGSGGAGPTLTSSGNVSLGSGATFATQVFLNAGNRQFGQLNVDHNGTVTLGNAALSLNFLSLPTGNTFVIINNDGADAIVGTFAGLPEGSLFTAGDQQFGISYRGGDGNDVVLHRPTNATWDGGGTTLLWSEAANWVGDIAPGPGDNLVFPAGVAKLTAVNDLPDDTTINSITISGPGYTLDRSGPIINLSAGIRDTVTSGASTIFAVPLRLTANQTFFAAGSPRAIEFKISIDTNGNTLTLDGPGFSSFSGLFGPVLTGNGGIIRQGTGSTELLQSHTYTGTTVVTSGSLEVNGSVPNSSVSLTGGILGGRGTTGPILATGGILRPSRVQLPTGSALTVNGGLTLNSGATFETTVAAGSQQFTQMKVNGALSLGNSTLSIVPVQPLPSGINFTIIDNDGADPISGTFAGLPEGATVTAGGIRFGITYKGGDGNDVALHLARTSTWDGGGTTNNWSDAANWSGDVAPGPGDDLIFPAGAGRLSNTNNFDAGTTFNSISLTGGGYALGGAALELSSGITSNASNSILFPIALTADQIFTVNSQGTLSFSNSATIDNKGHLLTLSGNGFHRFTGPISGSGGLTQDSGQRCTLFGNNTYSGPTTVLNGTLLLLGNQSTSPVQLTNGTLSGGGTVGPLSATGGALAPAGAASTDVLRVAGNVTLGSNTTFDVDIQGRPVGNGYDQLNVSGAVNLGNSTLNLDLIEGFVPSSGDVFIIVNNDGSDPVNGTFAGLPEGSTVAAVGQQFKISYLGNDGNDVTLAFAGPVPTPTTVQFDSSVYLVGEGDGHATVTVTRNGDTTTALSVGITTSDAAGSQSCNVFNGSASARCDYTIIFGTVQIAAGETSRTFTIPIIDDSYAEGNEKFTVTLNNVSNAVLGLQTSATVMIVDNETTSGPNPIDGARFFVRQHYLDFLSREPDPSGFDFWTDQITSCGSNPQCVEVQRVNVSASFYLSIEFQGTGYLVERIYKVAYGDATGISTFPSAHQLPVPIVRFEEFLPDTQTISRGVIVGQGNWEQVLENNKQTFSVAFAQRSRFTAAFPDSMTAAQFVDKLNANAGNPLSQAERDQLVSDLSSGARSRGQVLRAVAEDSDLTAREFNRAFVLMQYFGYLRRNPNDPQDPDHTGYDFWLTKLNQFNGNYIDAEMVKAFITSFEYRQRLGP